MEKKNVEFRVVGNGFAKSDVVQGNVVSVDYLLGICQAAKSAGHVFLQIGLKTGKFGPYLTEDSFHSVRPEKDMETVIANRKAKGEEMRASASAKELLGDS
jgi:topoisomerase IA-like protein